MTISNSKEGTNRPRHDVTIEIGKISALGTPNQILIQSKVLSDHVFDTLEHFSQITSLVRWVSYY